MAWPSSTKAATTNVDAGSDSPSSARSDIKQNIDNVNAIIDEFDIASPSNGDILTYNSTSGAWEPGAAASGGTSTSFIGIESGEENVSSDIYRSELSEVFDNGGIITMNGSYQFTLTAGTYMVVAETFTADDDEVLHQLYNETDDVSVGNFAFNEIGTTGESVLTSGKLSFTISGTKNFSFRQTTANPSNRASQPMFRIVK